MCGCVVSAWTYILANKPNGVLYIGVTANLARRMMQHRAGTDQHSAANMASSGLCTPKSTATFMPLSHARKR